MKGHFLMRKKLSLVLIVFAVIALSTACSVEGTDTEPTSTPAETQAPNEETQDSSVIALVNGEPIYKESYDDAYEYYQSYFASIYGDDLSTYESEISEAALSAAVNEKIYMDKLNELGYLEYTEEQIADAETKAQEDIDYYIEQYYGEEIKTGLGDDYTDDEYKAATLEYEDEVLSSVFEMTREEIVDYYLTSAAQDRAYEDIEASVVPTEEEITAYYEQVLADYKASVTEDPSLYISDANAGSSAYYVPEGVRSVRQVLIKIDQEIIDAINLLRSNGLDDAADVLLEQGLKDIEDSANEVLSELQNGEKTFSEAIEEYNDDTGMPEVGYAVIKGVDNYVEQFTQAALELEEIGDVTPELIASDYGYHVIEYYSNIDEGELSLDDVYDDIYEELTDNLASEAWTDATTQWEQEAGVEYFYENL